MTEEVKELPAIGVSLQVVLDQSRTLVLQTHVAREDQAVINGVLDQLTRASDRQEAKYMVEKVKRLLRQAERNYIDTENGIERRSADARAEWEAGNRAGEFTLTGAAAVDVNNSLKSLARFREEMDAHRAEIDRLEKLAE